MIFKMIRIMKATFNFQVLTKCSLKIYASLECRCASDILMRFSFYQLPSRLVPASGIHPHNDQILICKSIQYDQKSALEQGQDWHGSKVRIKCLLSWVMYSTLIDNGYMSVIENNLMSHQLEGIHVKYNLKLN